jgi:hypothetical protein
MQSFISRIRSPVQRAGAERYVRITLLSFAGTVLLTRLFLSLTGYPQLGTSTLHIAHVLWGGLLLFVGALLPLIFANRAVYTLGALLSGIGVGLFIDEVGKFITQTNDYFYPAAAPIIYAFFLLTVLLYVRLRRPRSYDVRAELYRALDSLAEVLDHDLDANERSDLIEQLRSISRTAGDPDLIRLAQALEAFVDHETLYVTPARPSLLERWWAAAVAFEIRYVTRLQFTALLVVGLLVAGLPGLANLFILLLGFPASGGGSNGAEGIGFQAVAEGIVDVPLVVAAVLFILGDDRRGVSIAYVSLLLALTVVNVLVFYFDQFHAVFQTLIQFGLLMGMLHYRRRYLEHAAVGPEISSQDQARV